MDANFNNLQNGESQGGFPVFLSDKFNNIAPIAWSSTNLKCVARSTLAAETLTLSDGCDMLFIASLAKEMISKCFKDIRIKGYTDNHSLYKSLNTTKSILDKCLRAQISALREMCDKNELSIHWIEKQYQVSDVLAKKGASHECYLETLQKGQVK